MKRTAFRADKSLAILGAVIMLGFFVLALFADVLAPSNPTQPDLINRLLPPAWAPNGSLEHLFGTDHLGRDLLSRLFYGTRVALIVGLLGVAGAAIIGVTLGLLAGYYGRWFDVVVMRVVDTLISIPDIILYLTVLAIFGGGVKLLVLVIAFVNWTTFARLVRAEVLKVRGAEHVEAARALGQNDLLIVLRHVFPETLAAVVVVATLEVAVVIILESSLSFLGLGVQPPTITWGRMLADGRQYIATAWWIAAFPGLFITMLCLSLILIGDWLRGVLDPTGGR